MIDYRNDYRMWTGRAKWLNILIIF